MTEGEVIRHPGRWWQLCVAPYFADRGVGDMRGRVKVAPKSHPGGGARLSAVAVDALAASVAALLCSAVGARLQRCFAALCPLALFALLALSPPSYRRPAALIFG